MKVDAVATRKTKKVDTSNPYLYPECPKELLELMREIYAKYTGYEVASAIRSIRTELEIASGQRNAETLLPLNTEMDNTPVDN